MQCLFFIWRPGHHRSSEELQGLGKGVMGDSKIQRKSLSNYFEKGLEDPKYFQFSSFLDFLTMAGGM